MQTKACEILPHICQNSWNKERIINAHQLYEAKSETSYMTGGIIHGMALLINNLTDLHKVGAEILLLSIYSGEVKTHSHEKLARECS